MFPTGQDVVGPRPPELRPVPAGTVEPQTLDARHRLHGPNPPLRLDRPLLFFASQHPRTRGIPSAPPSVGEILVGKALAFARVEHVRILRARAERAGRPICVNLITSAQALYEHRLVEHE